MDPILDYRPSPFYRAMCWYFLNIKPTDIQLCRSRVAIPLKVAIQTQVPSLNRQQIVHQLKV